MSRATLREALRLLETQGLITLKPGPGGGTVVGSVEPSFLSRTLALYFHLGATTYDQLMRTQVSLESTCAELAAGHPDRVNVLAPFRAGCDHEDDAVYHESTVGFHGAVYQLAANPSLSLLTQAVTYAVTQHVLAHHADPELHPRTARRGARRDHPRDRRRPGRRAPAA